MEQNIQSIQQKIVMHGFQVVLYVTGCGAKAMEWFTSMNSSSSFALECCSFYSRGSLQEVLKVKEIQTFVSSKVALDLAQIALIKAHQIIRSENESDHNKYMKSIGIGLTGSIATSQPKKGPHHAYFCIHFLDSRYGLHIQLKKGDRTRQEEDTFISLALYQTLLNLIENRYWSPKIEDNIEMEEALPFLDQYDLLAANRERFFNLVIEVDGSLHLNRVLSKCIVVSGSFNPLHEGHIQLAEQAQQVHKFKDVYYELSLPNADKGMISKEELCNRMTQFKGKHRVILSMRPLFRDKNVFLRDGAFALGIDTYKRIIDVKYYNHSCTDRDISFIEFLKNNNIFIVAPRHNQEKKIESLQDFDIPSIIKKNVYELKDFINDLSSTHLRCIRAKSLPL